MKKSILLISALALTTIHFSIAQDAKQVSSAGMQAAADNPNAAEIKFDMDEYNFGSAKQGDKVDYEFFFTNTGKEPLIITNASGSCGCTVPVWPKEPIKKGERAGIKVSFNTAGKQGMQDKTITINSNARTNPKIIHIKGNVEVPAQPAATDAPKN